MDEGGSEFGEVGDASVFRDITNCDEDGSASTLLSGSTFNSPHLSVSITLPGRY